MLDTAPAISPHQPRQAAATAHDRCQAPSGRHPWFVVATKPKAERIAHASLHRRGFEAYLPLTTSRRRDGWRTSPLFPGYCFVRIDLERPWHPIRYAPGVFQLLAVNGKPAPCRHGIVEALQSALHGAEAAAATSPRWKPGTPCSLALGPGNAMSAVVLDQPDPDHVIVALMMLGELRQVSVRENCLQPRS